MFRNSHVKRLVQLSNLSLKVQFIDDKSPPLA